MVRHTRSLVVLAAFALAGCGIKGPLYLPPPATPAAPAAPGAPAAPAPATEPAKPIAPRGPGTSAAPSSPPAVNPGAAEKRP
jgi:predicted small lipoprotein YifL